MSDFIKAPIILLGYLLFAPIFGYLIRSSRKHQRWVMQWMVFMTSWHINKFTLMLNSIETYRGHTKGFEFSLIEMLSITLLVAVFSARGTNRRDGGWPPGLGLWLLYCFLSFISITAAPNTLYTMMASVRFTKAIVIFAATYHFIRDEEDVRSILRAVAYTLIIQAGVVLKLKYVDHFYQIRGWFEHQNPLAMYAYMLGLPLLAAAMAPVSVKESQLYLAGFVGSALIVQGSLSRGALIFFAVGVGLVVVQSYWDRITPRRLTYVTALGVLGSLGVMLALGTIMGRFHDEGNQASGETRDVMNQASKAMLDASKVGIGWNNFALTINAPFPYGEVINDWEREHGHPVDEDYAKGVVESHYWLLLAETGYGGFVSYLLFILVTTWWCVRGMFRWRRLFLGPVLGPIGIAFVLIYVHSNLERVLTQTKNLSAWFLYLGLASRSCSWRQRKK